MEQVTQPTRQPLQPLPTNTRIPACRPEKKKPGPKPKPLAKRAGIVKRVRRVERSYSREKKIQVLTYLIQHKVIRTEEQQRRRRVGMAETDSQLQIPLDRAIYRDITQTEAAEFFSIPRDTIQYWWKQRHKLLENKPREGIPWWPELEQQLFDQFIDRRQRGKLTTISWFRRTSRQLYAQIYEKEELFTFSNGWFIGFRERWSLSFRRVTHQASKLPEEYVAVTNSFLKSVI